MVNGKRWIRLRSAYGATRWRYFLEVRMHKTILICKFGSETRGRPFVALIAVARSTLTSLRLCARGALAINEKLNRLKQ